MCVNAERAQLSLFPNPERERRGGWVARVPIFASGTLKKEFRRHNTGQWEFEAARAVAAMLERAGTWSASAPLAATRNGASGDVAIYRCSDGASFLLTWGPIPPPPAMMISPSNCGRRSTRFYLCPPRLKRPQRLADGFTHGSARYSRAGKRQPADRQQQTAVPDLREDHRPAKLLPSLREPRTPPARPSQPCLDCNGSELPLPLLTRVTGEIFESSARGKQQPGLFPSQRNSVDTVLTQTRRFSCRDFRVAHICLIFKGLDWLPPRDSNPDMLIQSQLSCH